MQYENHHWKPELRLFPSSPYPWSTETSLSNACYEYQEYQRHQDLEVHRNKALIAFHMPFHSEALRRVQSKHLVRFLTTIYKGPADNLLEQLSSQLFEYHVERGGNKPGGIILGREHLKRMGTDPRDVHRILNDLNRLLESMVVFQFERANKKGNFIYLRITPYIPDTGCSLELAHRRKSA